MAEATESEKIKHLDELLGSDRTPDNRRILAETLKSYAEYEKATVETTNHRSSSWHEFIKTTASGVVPLLTLITLAFTFYFQWSQSRSADRASEDSRWRTVVETMRHQPGPTTDLVVITGLSPFFTSARYKSQAYDTMVLMASRLYDSLAFETLFNAAFSNSTQADLPLLNRLDAVLNRKLAQLDEVEEWTKKNPGKPHPMQMLGGGPREPPDPELLRHLRKEVTLQKQTVANRKIALQSSK